MGRAHNHNKFSPVAQIPFADEITTAIEAFAADKGLDCEPYYHDLPVWVVAEPQLNDTTIRHLQITAYLVSDTLYLSLVPSVHINVASGTSLVPKKVAPQRFSIHAILADDQKFNQDKFYDKLETVWDLTATLKFKPEEFMEVRLPRAVVLDRPTYTSAHKGPA